MVPADNHISKGHPTPNTSISITKSNITAILVNIYDSRLSKYYIYVNTSADVPTNANGRYQVPIAQSHA